jgi:hypothetical protein
LKLPFIHGTGNSHFYSNYHIIYQRRSLKRKANQQQQHNNQNKKKKKDDDYDDINNKQKNTNQASTTNTTSYELYAHRMAGYCLSIFVVAHVLAVRVTPLLYFDNPKDFDYSFAAAAIAFFPFHSLFTVYYILLGMAGGWHGIYGVRAALATTLRRGGGGQQSVVTGTTTTTTFPLSLKVLALVSHLFIIGAVLALGKYSTTMDWSERQRALHQHFFQSMGL